MRYFYYGKETEERGRVSYGRKNDIVLHSASMEKKTYAKEEDLVIEEDTIYEVDRMCLSRRQRQKAGRSK